ncbi:hypothetical protein, partial [Dyadobacter flavalbus]|uniref:hypothetical protein n=1 Tax=Dyadobacter flavalbus TaxID=2579942 RepID=UPI001E4926CF
FSQSLSNIMEGCEKKCGADTRHKVQYLEKVICLKFVFNLEFRAAESGECYFCQPLMQLDLGSQPVRHYLKECLSELA